MRPGGYICAHGDSATVVTSTSASTPDSESDSETGTDQSDAEIQSERAACAGSAESGIIDQALDFSFLDEDHP